MMTNMALFIDESKDQFEACKSLIEVERQVIGMPVVANKVCSCCCWRCWQTVCSYAHLCEQPFVTAERRLIKEGDVMLNNVKKHMFLLNDMILLTTLVKSTNKRRLKYTFMHQLPLEEVELFDYTAEKGMCSSSISSRRVGCRLCADTTDMNVTTAPVPTVLVRTKTIAFNCTFEDAVNKSFWLTALEQAQNKPAVVLNCHPMAL